MCLLPHANNFWFVDINGKKWLARYLTHKCFFENEASDEFHHHRDSVHIFLSSSLIILATLFLSPPPYYILYSSPSLEEHIYLILLRHQSDEKSQLLPSVDAAPPAEFLRYLIFVKIPASADSCFSISTSTLYSMLDFLFQSNYLSQNLPQIQTQPVQPFFTRQPAHFQQCVQ